MVKRRKIDIEISTKGLPEDIIENMVYLIRGQRVMLDSDLADLYGVETKRLKAQVRRNIKRFPDDFMFQLTKEEFDVLRSQFASSSWGGKRYLPYVFTEQGVAMLSGVLNSDRAIQMNIAIMRTFTKLRRMISVHKDLKRKIENIEKKYDEKFQVVFTVLKKLLDSPEKPKKKIGFHK